MTTSKHVNNDQPESPTHYYYYKILHQPLTFWTTTTFWGVPRAVTLLRLSCIVKSYFCLKIIRILSKCFKSRNCLLFSFTLWRVKFRRFEYFFVFVNSPNWFFNFKITLFILIIINIADGVDKCSEIFLFNFSFLLWQYVDWVQTN
jgi:hypothetical protein